MADNAQTKSRQDLFDKLRALLKSAIENGEPDADSGVLAVASGAGTPSARVINFQLSNDDRLAFFVSAKSLKASDIAANPQVAFCIFWKSIMLQVVIDGVARQLGPNDADHLWSLRDRSSQLAAHALRDHFETRAGLQARIKALKRQFSDTRVPKPADWLGFDLAIEHVGIWQTGWQRGHPKQHWIAGPNDSFQLARTPA